MKVIAIFAIVVAVALAAPQRGGDDKDAQVIRSELDNIGVDGYSYNYETSNGIAGQESAKLVNAGTENEAIQVVGSYEYTDKDGQRISVRYTADENGFVAEGDHIPKAP